MKIGIITFHWGANHGAILQAYASVHYLKNKQNVDDVRVIDYCPHKHRITLLNSIKPRRPMAVVAKIKTYCKNKKLVPFRNKLPKTASFYSNEQLKKAGLDFDVVFCGSDQIWNPSFSMHGEGKPTPTYLLDFCKEGCKRVALSVSFGCVDYPDNAANYIKQFVEKFDSISVRENTGGDILKKIGIDGAIVTADPTAIVEREHYLSLCDSVPVSSDDFVSVCLLRKPIKVLSHAFESFAGKIVNIESVSMAEWLAGIRDAKFVVTNSFHCVMMCLKLHTPFAFIKESGSGAGMNDRLYTLLEKFSLTDCIYDLSEFDYATHSKREFNWDEVEKCMEEYANSLKEFLDNQLN